jgi:hypothetical protein
MIRTMNRALEKSANIVPVPVSRIPCSQPAIVRKELIMSKRLFWSVAVIGISALSGALLWKPSPRPGSQPGWGARPVQFSRSEASRQTGRADAPTQSRLVASFGKLPLSFEVNQGQTTSSVKFLSRGSGYTLFLTGDEAVLGLRKASNPKLENRRSKFETGNSKLEAEIPGSLLASLESPMSNLANPESQILNPRFPISNAASLVPSPQHLASAPPHS